MVPDLELLERYIAGKLDLSEQEALEKMLENDPLLADAIDGLKEVGDMGVARSSLARLYQSNKNRLAARTKKREQLSKRKSRIVLRDHMPLVMGLAAALVIVVVSVFVIRSIDLNFENNDASYISENTQEIPPVPLVSDSAQGEQGESKPIEKEQAIQSPAKQKRPEASPVTFAEAKSSIKESQPSPTQSTISQDFVSSSEDSFADEIIAEPSEQEMAIVQNEEDDFGAEDIYPESASDSFAEPKPQSQDKASISTLKEPVRQQISQTKKSAKTELNLLSDVESIPLAGDTIRVRESKGIPPKISSNDSTYVAYYKKSQRLKDKDNVRARMLKLQVIIDLLYEGIDAFRKEQFDHAKDKFDEILRASPHNVLAHHYNGLISMEEENFKAAIVYFRHNLDYPEEAIYEESRWYLSQAYVGAGRKRAAKKLLQEIVESDSPFKGQAFIQLKEMD